MSVFCLLYSHKGIAGVSEQCQALGLVCYTTWMELSSEWLLGAQERLSLSRCCSLS